MLWRLTKAAAALATVLATVLTCACTEDTRLGSDQMHPASAAADPALKAGSAQDPLLDSALPQTTISKGRPRSSSISEADLSGSTAQLHPPRDPLPRSAARARMGRVFHSLPPPESLEEARDCDAKILPLDGSALAVIDEALLEYLGTGLSPRDLGDGSQHRGANFQRASELDDWRALSSPLFNDLRQLEPTGGEQRTLQSATLEAEFERTMESGRLGVMLSEQRSLDPAIYRGWLIMYSMESTLPWCWLRIEVLDASSTTIELGVQNAVNDAVKKIAPGLLIRWRRSE